METCHCYVTQGANIDIALQYDMIFHNLATFQQPQTYWQHIYNISSSALVNS